MIEDGERAINVGNAVGYLGDLQDYFTGEGCWMNMSSEAVVEELERRLDFLRTSLYYLERIECRICVGLTIRYYPNAPTWLQRRGGRSGGFGTCDECWGTGRKDKSGDDLRKLEYNESIVGN